MSVRVLVVDLEVVGVASSAADAIDLTVRERPDVVLVPDREAADAIATASPRTRTVVLGQPATDGDDELEPLTRREHEVLVRMAAGLGNRAIAEDLELSLNTIRNYVQQVLTKLQAHSKLQAVAVAVQRGLITGR